MISCLSIIEHDSTIALYRGRLPTMPCIQTPSSVLTSVIVYDCVYVGLGMYQKRSPETSNDPITVAFEYGSLAFVDGLLRTCAFKYESLVFVYGLQVEVVLRKSYSVAQDTILIHQFVIFLHTMMERYS